MTDAGSAINVTVRVRPFTIQEAAQVRKSDANPVMLGDGSLAATPHYQVGQKGIRNIIKIVDDQCLVFDPPEDNPIQRLGSFIAPTGKRSKDQTFKFDRVFDEHTTQVDVYESTTKPLIDNVFDGYNATVFAYGATGCGKTHTISGTSSQPGIIFMAMQEIYEKAQELSSTKHVEVSLSYLEIYNETIRDLLGEEDGPKGGLMLREDKSNSVSVAGLSSHQPDSVQAVMDIVVRGNSNRTQSPTMANATSSRSHAVLQINVSVKNKDCGTNEDLTFATLSIIDLAGSERASATQNRGARLTEGANINKSLLALGSCINKLCEKGSKVSHIPYRNSKLTRLLKFSLGGNCRTVMIVCVSPSSQHFDETQNTLRYANRAKDIKTKAMRNTYNVDRHVKDYVKKISELLDRNTELVNAQSRYEEIAFEKFRKGESKKAEILHEGLVRMRAACDHSRPERHEHTGTTLRLKQIEKRISNISLWIGAFDGLCDNREDEEPHPILVSMRKTAQGYLAELELSRQHHHQLLEKSHWSRAIETAFAEGKRQLMALDGVVEGSSEEQVLTKELELMILGAENDMQMQIINLLKGVDSALVHILMQTHFETVAILNGISGMDDTEAMQAGRTLVNNLIQSIADATSQVIKEGGLDIVEPVPPRKSGTPKKMKATALKGPSPFNQKVKDATPQSNPGSPKGPRPMPPPAVSHLAGTRPNLHGSRAAAPSPKKKARIGGLARKAVAFNAGTPKKRSPVKKRAVHWKDDTDDGEIAEYHQLPPTPRNLNKALPPTPRNLNATVKDEAEPADDVPKLASDFSSLMVDSSDVPSSPLPAAPVPAGTGRFATGFLSKKADSSPEMMPPPSFTPGTFSGSESDNSPLREVQANSMRPVRNSLLRKDSSLENTAPARDDYYSSSSEAEALDKASAQHFSSEIRRNRRKSGERRVSADRRSLSMGGIGSNTAARLRRRSPTASSPPAAEPAGAARRFLATARDDARRNSVLSPSVTGVARERPIKGTIPLSERRSMFDLGRSERPLPARPSSRSSNGGVPGSATRTSGGGKAAWR